MQPLTLGKHIQLLRQHASMTQQQLCERTGLSYSTLAKIERGAIKSPSIFTIASIARELGSTLEKVMNLEPISSIDMPANRGELKFVYFDIHGVLLHFYEEGFMKLAEDAGVNVELVENTFWHYNDSACRGEMSLDDFNKAMAQRIGIKSVDWDKYYFDAIEPIHPMQELLLEASKKYKVGLLSNIFPGFLEKNIALGKLPDIKYDVIIDSSVVHAIKPEQEIFDIAESESGVHQSEILFIDDSRTYIMAAEKLSWRVMWCDDFRPEESARRVRHALGL